MKCEYCNIEFANIKDTEQYEHYAYHCPKADPIHKATAKFALNVHKIIKEQEKIEIKKRIKNKLGVK